jgi:hypothetical protein
MILNVLMGLRLIFSIGYAMVNNAWNEENWKKKNLNLIQTAATYLGVCL